MPLDKLLSFTKKVQDLADKPNATMTAAQVKAQFDAAPDELRLAFNALIDDLSSVVDGDSGADNVGATTIVGLTGGSVQSLLEALKTLDDSNFSNLQNQINGVVLGQVPDGSITKPKLSPSLQTSIDAIATNTTNITSNTNSISSSQTNISNHDAIFSMGGF